MKKILFVFSLIVSISLAEAGRVQDDLDSIRSLFRTDMNLAAEVALKLKEEYEWKNNRYMLMKLHSILGYIQYKKNTLDEAITHYLQSIGHGEMDPDKYAKDLIALYKTCGLIYMESGCYDLAVEYYGKGIDLSERLGNAEEFVSLNYNLSIAHYDHKEYDESIFTLKQALPIAETGSKRYFDILTMLVLSYEGSKEYEKSLLNSKILLEELPSDPIKMKGSALHNLARTYKYMGDLDNALITYEKAIEEKLEAGLNNPKLFSSYYGIGEAYEILGELEKSWNYFSKAESLMASQPLEPGYFELYDSQAELLRRLGDFEKSLEYKDKYKEKSNEYDALTEKVKEETEKFNLEQLTQDFLNDVKEERRAILTWFWLIFAGTGFLFIIGAFIYHIIRLRRKVTKIRQRVGLAVGHLGALGGTI